MQQSKIEQIEKQIYDLTAELKSLKLKSERIPTQDFVFATELGTTTLQKMFGTHEKLLVIHNMGQACRYCTLWADGINGFLPHLENCMSVVLVSKDDPATQRRFANSRGWRFKLASHQSNEYAKVHTSSGEYGNLPGAAVFELEDKKIFKKSSCMFGPGDLYCSFWNFLTLAGIDGDQWTPQFRYWSLPEKLDDGGANVSD